MYLHITHDDKFIDFFIRIQTKNFTDEENKYLIYSDSDELRFVKSNDILLAKLYSKRFWSIVNSPEIKRIYIHYFHPKLSDFVLKISEHIDVYWVFWGSDGFYLPEIQQINLDAYTYNFFKKNHPYLFLKYDFIHMHKTIIWKQRVRNHLKAMQRINYFCHYSQNDYNILKSVIGFNATLLDFNYGSLIDISRPEDKLCLFDDSDKRSIFVGNSAAESNNHYSAFELIKNKNIDFDNLYCPLSYAGYNDYKKEVIRLGKYFFGHKFIGLTAYLSKNEYYDLMKKCNYFIQNHNRSQAYSNIAWQLFAGGNVIMNNNSSLVDYLTEKGVYIITLEEDNWKYTNAQKENNSRSISLILSEESVIKRYNNLFK